MKTPLPQVAIAAVLVVAAVSAFAVDGTVINKTTGKPSAGDKVALVDLSAGMADVATAITDPAGRYALPASRTGAYLIRVDHQGASYFIAAPSNGSADITVYDVAAKVDGVAIDADMLLIEAGRSSLHVRERYLVRNVSSPPRTQYSEKSFEIELPQGAVLEEAAATRPGGMGTRTHLTSLPTRGHYAFNVPIQPNQGEKETMFEVAYHFPYSGRQTLALHPIAPADHFVVYTAKGIKFTPRDASRFKAEQQDAQVDTHVAMNAHIGEEIAFTVSGEGDMPTESTAAMQLSSVPGTSGENRNVRDRSISPGSLVSSNAWLLAGSFVLLVGSGLVLRHRRKDSRVSETPLGPVRDSESSSAPSAKVDPAPRPEGTFPILESLKEELFALEQEKVSGKVSDDDYARIKTGLEAVLKRALNANSRQA